MAAALGLPERPFTTASDSSRRKEDAGSGLSVKRIPVDHVTGVVSTISAPIQMIALAR